MDWFLYDIGLHHERVNLIPSYILDALVVNVLFFSSKQIDAADDMNSMKNNILWNSDIPFINMYNKKLQVWYSER